MGKRIEKLAQFYCEVSDLPQTEGLSLIRAISNMTEQQKLAFIKILNKQI